MRYSNTTKQFYPKSRNYSELPDDLIDVLPADLKAALNRKLGESLDVVNGRVVVVSKSFAVMQSDKRIDIRNACRAAITAGIDHDALGAVHHYPTTTEDQANINALVTLTTIKGDAEAPYKFWCSDADGLWERRGHTVEQIKAVGIAMAKHVIDQQNKYETKLTAIDAAASVEALNQIVW
jgi:hypothetical protein